ncbi:hypothetical protein HZH66_013237 [Vespula vulgaris]|uniref:Uncharacterized protein n=1 Tax=Vespula vulgaris TaxID=7454 RepID=A0A834MSE6_VESVU|nr:hypothetical protein HZH66_013237 [Vespula vulgaris]
MLSKVESFKITGSFSITTSTTSSSSSNSSDSSSSGLLEIALQQMYGSNGASAGLPVGMTTLKATTGTLSPLGNFSSGLGHGLTGATTLPRPGNWLRPAGLRLGHSEARVRLYCQAKGRPGPEPAG